MVIGGTAASAKLCVKPASLAQNGGAVLVQWRTRRQRAVLGNLLFKDSVYRISNKPGQSLFFAQNTVSDYPGGRLNIYFGSRGSFEDTVPHFSASAEGVSHSCLHYVALTGYWMEKEFLLEHDVTYSLGETHPVLLETESGLTKWILQLMDFYASLFVPFM